VTTSMKPAPIGCSESTSVLRSDVGRAGQIERSVEVKKSSRLNHQLLDVTSLDTGQQHRDVISIIDREYRTEFIGLLDQLSRVVVVLHNRAIVSYADGECIVCACNVVTCIIHTRI